MYKIEHRMLSKEERDIRHQIFGGYNTFPPNWIEISVEEFSESFRNVPTFIETKQLTIPFGGDPRKRNSMYKSATLYHFNSCDGVSVCGERVNGKWETKFFSFDAISELEKWFTSLNVVDDSGWSLDKVSSRPNRGIRDYNRTIEFRSPIPEETLQYVKKYLATVNCPGWTGVSYTLIPGTKAKYRFRTTFDSSD